MNEENKIRTIQFIQSDPTDQFSYIVESQSEAEGYSFATGYTIFFEDKDRKQFFNIPTKLSIPVPQDEIVPIPPDANASSMSKISYHIGVAVTNAIQAGGTDQEINDRIYNNINNLLIALQNLSQFSSFIYNDQVDSPEVQHVLGSKSTRFTYTFTMEGLPDTQIPYIYMIQKYGLEGNAEYNFLKDYLNELIAKGTIRGFNERPPTNNFVCFDLISSNGNVQSPICIDLLDRPESSELNSQLLEFVQSLNEEVIRGGQKLFIKRLTDGTFDYKIINPEDVNPNKLVKWFDGVNDPFIDWTPPPPPDPIIKAAGDGAPVNKEAVCPGPGTAPYQMPCTETVLFNLLPTDERPALDLYKAALKPLRDVRYKVTEYKSEVNHCDIRAFYDAYQSQRRDNGIVIIGPAQVQEFKKKDPKTGKEKDYSGVVMETFTRGSFYVYDGKTQKDQEYKGGIDKDGAKYCAQDLQDLWQDIIDVVEYNNPNVKNNAVRRELSNSWNVILEEAGFKKFTQRKALVIYSIPYLDPDIATYPFSSANIQLKLTKLHTGYHQFASKVLKKLFETMTGGTKDADSIGTDGLVLGTAVEYVKDKFKESPELEGRILFHEEGPRDGKDLVLYPYRVKVDWREDDGFFITTSVALDTNQDIKSGAVIIQTPHPHGFRIGTVEDTPGPPGWENDHTIFVSLVPEIPETRSKHFEKVEMKYDKFISKANTKFKLHGREKIDSTIVHTKILLTNDLGAPKLKDGGVGNRPLTSDIHVDKYGEDDYFYWWVQSADVGGTLFETLSNHADEAPF